MTRLEWSELAVEDMGSSEGGIAIGAKQFIERIVATGSGDVKRLLRTTICLKYV